MIGTTSHENKARLTAQDQPFRVLGRLQWPRTVVVARKSTCQRPNSENANEVLYGSGWLTAMSQKATADESDVSVNNSAVAASDLFVLRNGEHGCIQSTSWCPIGEE
jgi:hypothetical protein